MNVPRHFSIILDKSALQRLSPKEARWLCHHFIINVPPVFFSEIIADLTKKKNFSTDSAVGDVKMLSAKLESPHMFVNAEAKGLIDSELAGRGIPLGGIPISCNVERFEIGEGEFGISVDGNPLQRLQQRWREGDFHRIEEDFAESWREGIADIDLEKIVRSAKNFREKSINTPKAVMDLVKSILFEGDQYTCLTNWMGILGIPDEQQKDVITLWTNRGNPPAIKFAGYTAYSAKVELYFYLAVAHGVITTRKTNRIDIEYFKYLPFTRVFSSADKLHKENFPVLAPHGSLFIEANELKMALGEMVIFYEALHPEVLAEGSLTYAKYPPVHMDNSITRVYDQLKSDWRDRAKEPKAPKDPYAEARLLEALEPMFGALDEHRRKNRP